MPRKRHERSPEARPAESPTTTDALAQAAAAIPPGRESLLEFADAAARLAAQQARAAPVPELRLVTFVLDREDFGIPIAAVREVVRVGHVARVPHAPPHIRGVANLRGRLLPVVELRTRLGLAAGAPTPASRIVVVEVHARTLGLFVDAVRHVVRVPTSAVLPPPEEVLSVHADFITGVARLGERLVILLDLERALLLPAA